MRSKIALTKNFKIKLNVLKKDGKKEFKRVFSETVEKIT